MYSPRARLLILWGIVQDQAGLLEQVDRDTEGVMSRCAPVNMHKMHGR